MSISVGLGNVLGEEEGAWSQHFRRSMSDKRKGSALIRGIRTAVSKKKNRFQQVRVVGGGGVKRVRKRHSGLLIVTKPLLLRLSTLTTLLCGHWVAWLG